MTHRRLQSVVSGRGFLLLPAAAYVVHQLRYKLAYGSQANQMLAAQGHSYLDSLAPWLVLMLGIAFGTFLLRIARAFASRGDDRRRRSFLGLWTITWASLVLLYTIQELLEGFFAVGHPGGLAGVFGHGGWWAPIVAVPVAAVLAALLHVAYVLVRIAARPADRYPSARSSAPLRRLSSVLRSPLPPLAGSAAGRAPPLGFTTA
jgi:hypothetical protein